jgi:hypothetical protein
MFAGFAIVALAPLAAHAAAISGVHFAAIAAVHAPLLLATTAFFAEPVLLAVVVFSPHANAVMVAPMMASAASRTTG